MVSTGVNVASQLARPLTDGRSGGRIWIASGPGERNYEQAEYIDAMNRDASFVGHHRCGSATHPPVEFVAVGAHEFSSPPEVRAFLGALPHSNPARQLAHEYGGRADLVTEQWGYVSYAAEDTGGGPVEAVAYLTGCLAPGGKAGIATEPRRIDAATLDRMATFWRNELGRPLLWGIGYACSEAYPDNTNPVLQIRVEPQSGPPRLEDGSGAPMVGRALMDAVADGDVSLLSALHREIGKPEPVVGEEGVLWRSAAGIVLRAYCYNRL
jgi:hypothetical protein